MQNAKELVNIHNFNSRKWCLLEYIVMMVLGNDVFCIGFKGAVHKLVIIRIYSNQAKMVVRTIFITACMECACVRSSNLLSHCR
jgi:hypothetical protein